jgi:hypothetical protein
VWRALIEGRDVLKEGIIRHIGMGEKTNAHDFSLCPLVCKKENPPLQVAAFIDNTTATWKSDILQECFIPMDVEVIQSIPLSTQRMEDFWAWHYEKNGVPTVRSVYRLLVETKRRREDWLDGRAVGLIRLKRIYNF